MFASALAVAVVFAGEPAGSETVGAELPPAVPEGPSTPAPGAERSRSERDELEPYSGAPPPRRGHALTAAGTTWAASSALWSVVFVAARNDPDYDVPGSQAQVSRDAERRLRQDIALGINLGLFGAATVGAVVGAVRVHRFDRWRRANAVAPVHDGAALTGAGVGLLLSGASFGASTGPSLFYRADPARIGLWAGVTAAYVIGGSVTTALGVRKLRRSRTLVTGRYGFVLTRAGAPGSYAFGLQSRRSGH